MPKNRLASEKSPYLLQHAENPVDWYPWGEEAFGKARAEDKPIFLSVGYSTCHWCHVMERESFERQDVADILNRYFVPVKVDREERPDVDRVYMTFVQATTGSGGWPMSVWLTPDLKPFFGGTYFPREDYQGRPGFKYVLERLADAWRSERGQVLESAASVVEQLKQHAASIPGKAAADGAIPDSAFYAFRRSFDARFGGFGGAPKFPRPAVHNFLLRHYHRTGREEALNMTLATLAAMARGGMNDQLGGGFHRYSVDERWFVPHFEKMLYDQAQIALSFIEAFQITGDEFYALHARQTLDYTLRDMSDGGGGFYSAEDADSAADPDHPEVKREGAFYVWTQQEIEEILGQPDAEMFSFHYGVEPRGNVAADPHDEFRGKNILFEARTVEETAQKFGVSPEVLRTTLGVAKQNLLDARARRIRPHLDDKILTCWNGLMISALAKAGAALDEPRYLTAARRAADFVLGRLYSPETRTLLRRYRDGDAAITGFLDDYAFFAQGLLDLYETDFKLSDLENAIALTEAMLVEFEDKEQGAFFSTAADEPALVIRMKDDYDGAEPSGNSIALINLLRLADMTDRQDFREAADRTMTALAPRMAAAPAAVPQTLCALEYTLAPHKQIVIVGTRQREDTRRMRMEIARRFLPNDVSLLVDSDEARDFLAGRLPVIDSMREVNGSATAYVCENYSCQAPTTDPERLADLLGKVMRA